MQLIRKASPLLASALLLLVSVDAAGQVPTRPPAPRRPNGAEQLRRQQAEEEEERRLERAQNTPQVQAPRPARPIRPNVPPRPVAPPSSQPPAAPPSSPATGQDASKAEADPEAQRRNREAARTRGRFQLDFDKAEIADVVQTISDFTGRLFIVPENIRGKITIIGPEDGTGLVSANEAYAAFLAALEANNWTVYPVGKYLKLVEKRAAPNSNVWTYTDPKAQIPADERMVTKVLRVRYVDTDTLANPLKQLASKDASIIALPPDTLIVTETALNLRRLERIIGSLDQPGGGDELRLLPVEFASATEIADKIVQIFEAGGGAPAPQPTRRGRPTPPPPAGQPAEGGPAGAVSVTRVLADERTNQLIIIASARAFEQIQELVRQLDVPTGDTGRVNVYYLENANAEELATTLQSLTTGGAPQTPTRGRRAAEQSGATSAELFAGEVKISADKATNSLVIVASAQDYKNLTRVIQRLDIPRRQVFVEAVIMEVNLRNNDEFGMSFHGGYAVDTDDGIAPVIVGSQTGQASSLNLASLVSLGGFLAGVQGPNVPAASELGVALPSFGLVMHALTTSSDVNVLSTPHILTSDNEEAEITVGQNVPFQAGYAPQGLGNLLGGAAGQQNVNNLAGGLLGSSLLTGGLGSLYAPIQRQNVELRLKIKPQINESDYIRMEVEEQTEEIAEQDPQLGPTTAKRTAKTVVVAKDQTTVVIGGLIQERLINSVSKTPILGDIPVIGRLFRETSQNRQRTNLLLFLTPYIIRDQSDFRRIFERKMREREEFIAAFYGTAPQYEVPIDYARKAGPVALLSKDVRAELVKLENGGEGAPGQREVRPQSDVQYVPRGSVPEGEESPAEAVEGEAETIAPSEEPGDAPAAEEEDGQAP